MGNGVRVRIRRTGREVEKKRKKNKENTTNGENVLIRFKIDKTKKKIRIFFIGWKILNWFEKFKQKIKINLIHNINHLLVIIQYIEDITQWHEDMNFIFVFATRK